MASQDLIREISTSRIELGANDAFPMMQREAFYFVENGHVDLFIAGMNKEGDTLTRRPFVTRILAGNAFFGAPAVQGGQSLGCDFFVFQAVPSPDAVLLRGDRNRLASPESFDLEFISMIEDWLLGVSNMVSGYFGLPPRDAVLLEADPDVRYEAHSAVGTHHLEVLWVSADRPTLLMGRPEFSIAPRTVLPLCESLWLSLPEQTTISAVHTPGAVISGKLWEGLDRYHTEILRCAVRAWMEDRRSEATLQLSESRHKTQLVTTMVGDLGSLLGDTPRPREAERGHRSALQTAAAIVAQAAGGQLLDSPAALDDDDPLEAVGAMVAPSGIRTRRIRLSPGWERRNGPSFLGMLSDGTPRPVAVVNRGGAAFDIIDPVSGESSRVTRRRAETLGEQGIMFYAPLSSRANSGLAAVIQALRGRGRDIRNVGVMGALAALIGLLTPILTGELLAEIIPRVDIPMWVAALAALMLGAFAAAAISVVGALSMLRIEAAIDETLQAAIWNRLLSLPIPFFRRYLVGDLADRANGVSLIRQILTGATGSSLVSGAFSVFSYALLFYYSWELALWVGVALSVLVAGSWFFATRQMHHQRAAFMAQGVIDGLVFQLIIGLAKIRQANAELNALNWWARRYAEQRREQLSARKWVAGQLTFNAFFEPAAMILVLALIWYQLIAIDTDVAFSLADFLSFQAAFGQFVGGVIGLSATWASVVAILPLFERVQPIIEERPESAMGATVLPDVSGHLECEHVTFRYPAAARDTVSDVSFHIQPGEYVAFVGPSGSGKSTLYRLLLGFERPTSGSVLVDGHDLLSLNLPAMRRHFGVVLQNGQLVPDTIFRIIAGEAALTMDEAWEAARAVGLDKDIEALPIGMNTVLSENGGGLSGGQQQRLLVARALVRKPRVVLFDEATSMLDNRTQDTIRSTLRGMTATRVLIAHRLSTVVDADRIYVMQDGKIVETGRYGDLMKQSGVLADMARRQIV